MRLVIQDTSESAPILSKRDLIFPSLIRFTVSLLDYLWGSLQQSALDLRSCEGNCVGYEAESAVVEPGMVIAVLILSSAFTVDDFIAVLFIVFSASKILDLRSCEVSCVGYTAEGTGVESTMAIAVLILSSLGAWCYGMLQFIIQDTGEPSPK